jgi:hypothetical protein
MSLDKNRVSILQSRQSIRGSGIQEKADRLSSLSSFARSPNRAPANNGLSGKVIEKVVVAENTEQNNELIDLKARLNESLMRLVVVGLDNDRLKSCIKAKKPVFENDQSYELNNLKAEISR